MACHPITLNDVLEDVRRITGAADLPLLVDTDAGFGATAFVIARTVREMTDAGAAGIHIEEQAQAKRCGHRPGKEVVEADEMLDAKTQPDLSSWAVRTQLYTKETS